jgi:hypothetical protein
MTFILWARHVINDCYLLNKMVLVSVLIDTGSAEIMPIDDRNPSKN